MSLSHARSLRNRAAHLRAFASRMEASPLMRLDAWAGIETWRGRRPLLCLNLLATNQAQMHAEADDLRSRAYLFEQRAAEFEAQATLAPGRAG